MEACRGREAQESPKDPGSDQMMWGDKRKLLNIKANEGAALISIHQFLTLLCLPLGKDMVLMWAHAYFKSKSSASLSSVFMSFFDCFITQTHPYVHTYNKTHTRRAHHKCSKKGAHFLASTKTWAIIWRSRASSQSRTSHNPRQIFKLLPEPYNKSLYGYEKSKFFSCL